MHMNIQGAVAASMAVQAGKRISLLPPSGAEPYTWFPSLNKNTIPFHVAAGAWGTHRPIQEAAAPVTTSTGTAGTIAQLQAACYTPETAVTLTDVISGAVLLNGNNIRDVDVIMPNGTGIIATSIGAAPTLGRVVAPYRTIQRLRFRGSTPGSFSGGRIHNMTVFGSFEDLIFDGIQLSGPEGTNNSAALTFSGDDLQRQGVRLAIHNCRANCGGGFLIGATENNIFCNNSILTAQGTTDPVDAWGFRMNGLGHNIFYGNDIRASTARAGTSNLTYHRLRFSPKPSAYYLWATNNTLVDRVEGRILVVRSSLESPPSGGTFEGAWFDNNLVIATQVVSGTELSITDATYARITNNTIQSNIITSPAGITLGGPVTNGDKTTGNVFQALPGSDPAWGAVGDPSGVTWAWT